MHKLIALLVLIVPATVLADAKSDGQAKADAAKTEVCEKAKKFLDGRKAKGKCSAEADEAGKITCSAQTWKQVVDLQTKCATGKSASTDKSEKADEAPAPAGGTKCRALDGGKTVAEADDKLSTKCTRLLGDAVKKAMCTASAKGKKIEYTQEYDHVIGTGKFARKLPSRKTTLTCR
ncbi:MAG TPA: hypothetical protein VIU61_03590 [Kofleriaceae bacterium]